MKKLKNVFRFLTPIMVIIFLITPIFALAQGDQGGAGGGGDQGGAGGGTGGGSSSIKFDIPNPFKQDTIEALIRTIINDILIPIGGVIATVMIIYAGFKYVTAGGNDTKIKEAHDALKWAVIGAAILLGAWVISEAIGATINQLKGS